MNDSPARSKKLNVALLSGVVGIGALLLALGTILIEVRTNRDETSGFLKRCGLAELSSGGVLIRASVSPLVNEDYRNKVYFALLSMDRGAFEQFIGSKAFTRDDFLTLPTKESRWPKVPDWWDVPKPQTELFSKTMANTNILVMWKDGRVFLFGRD